MPAEQQRSAPATCICIHFRQSSRLLCTDGDRTACLCSFQGLSRRAFPPSLDLVINQGTCRWRRQHLVMSRLHSNFPAPFAIVPPEHGIVHVVTSCSIACSHSGFRAAGSQRLHMINPHPGRLPVRSSFWQRLAPCCALSL